MWIATFDMPREFSFLVEDSLCLHSELISQTQFDDGRGIKQLMLTIYKLISQTQCDCGRGIKNKG